MAQHNKAGLVRSYTDHWDVLQQLVTPLLLAMQEHTNLPCDGAHSNEGASNPCVRREGGQTALQHQWCVVDDAPCWCSALSIH